MKKVNGVHIADVLDMLNARIFQLRREVAVKRAKPNHDENEICRLDMRVLEDEWVIKAIRRMEQEQQ